MAILAIDFDNVLHDPTRVAEGKVLGPPMEGARDAICLLRNEMGHTIVVFSVKPPEVIAPWMGYFDIPYDRITNQKPIADLYLDDKGCRFYNWEEFLAHQLPYFVDAVRVD